MISYKFLKEHGLVPRSIRKNKSSYIVETVDNKKYVLKEEKNNSKYDYLVSRNFNYFPNNFNLDNYVVYEYLENINLSDEERLLDIVKLIGLLHAKTTRYKVIDIDDYKVIYEDLLKEIDTTTNYYLQLNDLIDNELYMAPSKYLLVRNISKIYSALSFCKFELDNWYELIKGKSKERLVYTHNNLEIDHLIRTNNPYLISWDKAKIDFPINDIYNLYKKYYRKSNFDILLNNYQDKYPLNEEELKLLFIKISIPDKIQFTNDEFENTKKVKVLVDYLNSGDKLIKPFYQKKRKTNV